jgi:hypothetical protein
MFTQSIRVICLFKAPAIAENREGLNPYKYIVDSLAMHLQKADSIPQLKPMTSCHAITTSINAPKIPF